MSGRGLVVASVRRHAHRAADRQQTTRRALVRSIDPIVVEHYHDALQLSNDNDFELSQWAKLYDAIVGIDRDDVVLMHQELHDWILFDIVSDKDVVGIFRQWDIEYGPDTDHPDP